MRERITPPTPKPPIIRELGEDPKRERNMAARRKKAESTPAPKPVVEEPKPPVGRTHEQFKAARGDALCRTCDWFEPEDGHGGTRKRGRCMRHPQPLAKMALECCSEHVPIP